MHLMFPARCWARLFADQIEYRAFLCVTLSDLNMGRVNTNVLLKFIVWRPSSSASSLIFTILLLNASWGPPSILGAGGTPSCSYNYDDDHDNQQSPH